MARTVYSEETKAVVMAALMEGQSVTYVANEYNIPLGTVKSWKNRRELETGQAVSSMVATQKKDIAVMIVDLLTSHLEAATKIANAIDGDYVKGQDASEVAVLLGVINDKAFRMMEALGRATANHPPEN